jgi:hypothetical protein
MDVRLNQSKRCLWVVICSSQCELRYLFLEQTLRLWCKCCYLHLWTSLLQCILQYSLETSAVLFKWVTLLPYVEKVPAEDVLDIQWSPDVQELDLSCHCYDLSWHETTWLACWLHQLSCCSTDYCQLSLSLSEVDLLARIMEWDPPSII